MAPVTSRYPIPTTHAQINRGKYPWRKLEVGQSFHVPFNGRQPFDLKHQLNTNGRTMARVIKKETGMDVEFLAGIRSSGVRVWRVK